MRLDLVCSRPAVVDYQHIGAAGPAGFIRVVGHRPGVGPGPVADNIHAHPLPEDFQLFLGSRPEGIGGAQDHFLASTGEVMGQLGDTGSLAHPH